MMWMDAQYALCYFEIKKILWKNIMKNEGIYAFIGTIQM